MIDCVSEFYVILKLRHTQTLPSQVIFYRTLTQTLLKKQYDFYFEKKNKLGAPPAQWCRELNKKVIEEDSIRFLCKNNN